MRPPTNVSELRRYMGMVNQLGKFSQNLAQISQPLRELLSAKLAWVWGPSQEESFSSIKAELCQPAVLAFYDPDAEILISADAGGPKRATVSYASKLKPIMPRLKRKPWPLHGHVRNFQTMSWVGDLLTPVEHQVV